MTPEFGTKEVLGGGTDFAQAYQRLAESGRYQTSMDQIPPPDPPSPPPEWLRGFLEMLGSAGGVFELLLWGLGALAIALILWFVIRHIVHVVAERRARAAGAQTEAPDWRPEAAPARALLEEADAMAARGEFVEAARLLLYRSLEDIQAKLPDFLRPALTSRDIGRAETLPGPARGAFATIAAVVERGVFATRPVDAAGWSEARGAYEQFAFGANWR